MSERIPTSWRAHFEAFDSAEDQPARRAALEAARAWVTVAPTDSVDGIREALHTDYWPQLWAAKLFLELEMPAALHRDFVRTVLDWPDPSDNRYFVEALAYSLGGQRTARLIMEVARPELEAEVVATSNAFYWLIQYGLSWRAKWFLFRQLLRARNPTVRRNLWSVLSQ